MKKRFIYLLSLLSLCLCACNSGNNKNVVDSPKYVSSTKYLVKEYWVKWDEYNRFCADLYTLKEYSELQYVKSICVYLSGIGILNEYLPYPYVVESKKINGGYDYYYYVSVS